MTGWAFASLCECAMVSQSEEAIATPTGFSAPECDKRLSANKSRHRDPVLVGLGIFILPPPGTTAPAPPLPTARHSIVGNLPPMTIYTIHSELHNT